MLESILTALHLVYDPHVLKDKCGSNNRFTWPHSTDIDNHFTIAASNQVVLMALPNAIAAAFGSDPPEGKIDVAASNLGQLEQNLDL